MGDTRRCPVCGAPVKEDALFCVNCGTRLDGNAGANPETTAVHPPVVPQDSATYQTAYPSAPAPAPAPEPPHGHGRELTIALASVAAALAVVAVVLAVVNFIPRQTQDSGNATQQAQTQTTNGSTDSSQQSGSDQGGQPSTNVTYYIGEGGTSGAASSDGGSSAPSSTSSDDASILSTLQAQKGTLNSLDTQIRNVATDFNRYSKNGSWDQQEAAASTAASVQGSVSSASSSFDGISVPTSSAYYGTYQSMKTCYDDLQKRIDCMVSAWNLRLSGSSDYLSPIRAQNDSKGVNVYKTDFENRMASLGI